MKEKLVKFGLTEELAQKVLDNFGTIIDGQYVPKTRLDEVIKERDSANETIKERDKQIEGLGKDAADIATLKKEKEDLIKANKTAKEESDKALAAERKSNAIKLELIGKVHNPEIAMTLLKSDEIVMGEDGKVKSGLKEQLDGLKKSDNYLFIPETKVNTNQNPSFQVKGATPKEGEGTQQTDLSAGEIFAKNLAVNANANVKQSAESVYFGESK